MNVFKRAISGNFSRSHIGIESPGVPLTSATLNQFLIPQTDAGVTVTEHSALMLSAVWRAVNMISGDISLCPLEAIKSLGDGGLLDVSSSFPVLDDPNPLIDSFTFKQVVVAHILLWGNHYSLKIRGANGRVRYLEPLRPECVDDPWVEFDAGLGRSVKKFKIQGGPEKPIVVLTDDDVYHVSGFSLDGIKGLSPIAYARQSMGLGVAAEKYGAKLFGSGALMSGILTTDKRIDDPAAKKLKERWQDAYGGLSKAHEVAILDSGAKFMPVSIPPEDAQFLETRRFTISDVGRWYGCPLHLLMETEKSTSWGTGLEQHDLGYAKHTLGQHFGRLESKATKELVGVRGVKARHNLEDLLRGDLLTRRTADKLGIEAGFLSRAHVQRKERVPVTDPRLEEYFQPQNTYTVDQVEEMLKNNAAQAAAPAVKGPDNNLAGKSESSDQSTKGAPVGESKK